jgi:hypothetical protein
VPLGIKRANMTRPPTRSVFPRSPWLTAAVGFTEHYRYGPASPRGARVYLRDAWIMLDAVDADQKTAAPFAGRDLYRTE